jgi:hypothetical protein
MRFMACAVISVFFAFSCISRSLASEEEYLQWKSVEIQCFENSQTGKVKLSASVGKQGIVSFTVTAFGKEHMLSPQDLSKIVPFPLNSVRTTHEAGYAMLGGHTVHVKFSRSHYSKAGKLTNEFAVVSVAKEKGITVSIHEKQ